MNGYLVLASLFEMSFGVSSCFHLKMNFNWPSTSVAPKILISSNSFSCPSFVSDKLKCSPSKSGMFCQTKKNNNNFNRLCSHWKYMSCIRVIHVEKQQQQRLVSFYFEWIFTFFMFSWSSFGSVLISVLIRKLRRFGRLDSELIELRRRVLRLPARDYGKNHKI